MTSPERIILDGRPRAVYADPLGTLLERRRTSLRCWWRDCSSCWRGYIGTWAVIDGHLCLVHINSWENGPCPDDLRRRALRMVRARSFPVIARWFTGRWRISLGRRLIYSHHGWSSWFERERVLSFRRGALVRDREVDTRRILEWWLRRHPEARGRLDPDAPVAEPGPLVWFEPESDAEEDWAADWWPVDYPKPTR